MDLSNIKSALMTRMYSGEFLIKKNSPEIMLVTGIGGGIAASVMLAKAYKKSDERLAPVLDAISEMREIIEENNVLHEQVVEREDIEMQENWQYITRTDAAKELLPYYLVLAKESVKLYAPAILVGGMSIMLILQSHRIMKGRNRALLSGFVLVERAFNTYRERVREELGKEGDERFLYGLEERDKTIITTDKDGKKKKTKATENALPEKLSPVMYQRVFDRTNDNWKEEPQLVAFFLGGAQSAMNDRLEQKGYVFLNEVYRLLGFKETDYGQVVGWSLAAPGDNFIMFGLDNDWAWRRPDGSVLLDFNVNGVVFDYIGKEAPHKNEFSVE